MNRFVRTGTIAAAIVGAIVAAALIVKEQLTGPAPALSGEKPASPSKPVAPAPSKAPAAPKPRKAPAKPKPAAAPTATDDDLTEIDFSEKNYIVFSRAGVSFSGVELALPNVEIYAGGDLQMRAEKLFIDYTHGEAPELKLNGLFKLPQFNTTVDLTNAIIGAL